MTNNLSNELKIAIFHEIAYATKFVQLQKLVLPQTQKQATPFASYGRDGASGCWHGVQGEGGFLEEVLLEMLQGWFPTIWEKVQAI